MLILHDLNYQITVSVDELADSEWTDNTGINKDPPKNTGYS